MRKLIATLVLLILFAAAAPESALAQCAMCKQSLESSGDAAALARGINLAVLVLLIPPVAIFAGIFGMFYRFDRQRSASAGEDLDTEHDPRVD